MLPFRGFCQLVRNALTPPIYAITSSVLKSDLVCFVSCAFDFSVSCPSVLNSPKLFDSFVDYLICSFAFLILVNLEKCQDLIPLILTVFEK